VVEGAQFVERAQLCALTFNGLGLVVGWPISQDLVMHHSILPTRDYQRISRVMLGSGW
jgi:hypothetical protein